MLWVCHPIDFIKPIFFLNLLNILLEPRKPVLVQRIPQSCEGGEDSDL